MDDTPTHYIEANSSNAGVISCDSSGCIIEDRTLKGYFINSSTVADAKHLISCNGTKCEELADNDASSDPGTIKVETSDKGVTTITFIISDDEEKEIKTGGRYIEECFSCRNIFPGVADSGKIPVNIGKDGSVIYLEDTSTSISN
eukprot:jgi/Orpsp1_1/1182979/evm.model.c7180000083365.1